MSAWAEAAGPRYGPWKRASRWELALQTDLACRCYDAQPMRPGVRGADYAPRITRPALRLRYEHVGFGDQFEPWWLLLQALEEFHIPRRKTQRN